MKRFYIMAHPNYFKKAMGWDMKDMEVKYTEDKLVMFIATDNVPETNIIEPYYCGWMDTEVKPITYNYLYNNIIDNDKEVLEK